MTILREAAQQALEALEGGADSWERVGPAIDTLRAALVEDAMQKFTDVNQELEAALAEPVQEPVARRLPAINRETEMTIVTSVCIFFAANPDEALNSDDIETKWGMCSDSTRRSLQYACHKGWLVRTRTPDKKARQRWRWVYTAGPRLLKEIGR